jgi:hypothetical protein
MEAAREVSKKLNVFARNPGSCRKAVVLGASLDSWSVSKNRFDTPGEGLFAMTMTPLILDVRLSGCR